MLMRKMVKKGCGDTVENTICHIFLLSTGCTILVSFIRSFPKSNYFPRLWCSPCLPTWFPLGDHNPAYAVLSLFLKNSYSNLSFWMQRLCSNSDLLHLWKRALLLNLFLIPLNDTPLYFGVWTFYITPSYSVFSQPMTDLDTLDSPYSCPSPFATTSG